MYYFVCVASATVFKGLVAHTCARTTHTHLCMSCGMATDALNGVLCVCVCTCVRDGPALKEEPADSIEGIEVR